MGKLVIDRIRSGYGQITVLHKVSLRVEEGEIITLLGMNGAGKSTLLRTITNLIPCGEGKITWQDIDIQNLPADRIVRLGIVHAPEGRQLFGPLSVQENLILGCYTCYHRLGSRGRQELFDFIFELFPILQKRRKQRAATLSGGEQQMLALSRALMSQPKLLLLDEPSLGLAPLVVENIFEVIQKLNRNGMGILLVEQDVLLALSIAARAYVLEVGRIVIEGEADALMRDDRIKQIHLGQSREEE